MREDNAKRMDLLLEDTQELDQILFEVMTFVPEYNDESYFEKTERLEKYFGRINSIE